MWKARASFEIAIPSVNQSFGCQGNMPEFLAGHEHVDVLPGGWVGGGRSLVESGDCLAIMMYKGPPLKETAHF